MARTVGIFASGGSFGPVAGFARGRFAHAARAIRCTGLAGSASLVRCVRFDALSSPAQPRHAASR
jgi:hypothetical protein